MTDLVTQRGMDLTIRIAELAKYLREDGRDFPLCDRLLACGTAVGLACREPDWPESRSRALNNVDEAEYLITVAIKSGYLTEKQGVHIRSDCEALKQALTEWKQEGNT